MSEFARKRDCYPLWGGAPVSGRRARSRRSRASASTWPVGSSGSAGPRRRTRRSCSWERGSTSAATARGYISPLEPAVPRPPRELKAFRKVFLRPGERRGVELRLPPRAPARFCPDADRWRVDPGKYELCISASSRDHRLRARVRHLGD